MLPLQQRYIDDWDRKISLTKAEDIVTAVDNVALNGDYSLSEACRLVGVSVDGYRNATMLIMEEHMSLTEGLESV